MRQIRMFPSPPQSPTMSRRILPAIPHYKTTSQVDYTTQPRQFVLPKSLKYDGSSSWQAFYTQFTKFAEASNWTIDECRHQLYWCWEGKTSEFYAMLADRQQYQDYMGLVRKFEKHFGYQGLPETLQMQFLSAR